MASSTLQLTSILSVFRSAFLVVFCMSGVVSLLALTGSFYMLQVYDRVLTSHSVETLVAFSVLAAGLYAFQAFLDILRGQILTRIGIRVDQRASPIAHDALLRLPLFGASTTEATRPIHDVGQVRNFLGSQGPVAIFDMPWMPLFLIFVFYLHFWLGVLATCGAIVLIGLTLLTEALSGRLSEDAMNASGKLSAIADSNARNAEVLSAMGFGKRAALSFEKANSEYLVVQSKANDLSGLLSGISKVFRMLLQSAVLGLGAYLTLQGEVTAGAIIAASIATSRSLAPVELAIGNWKNFVAARKSYARLGKSVGALPMQSQPLDLPAPCKRLALENLVVPIPGAERIVLSSVSFELNRGQGLGVIGPSASGKSSLARAITGVWPLVGGAIRLDGAAIDRWPSHYFSHQIGYLPQDVLLMDGTIAQNIARFDSEATSQAIIEAANAAGIHELVLRLPDGYETELGPGGTSLSAGQRQRIALARALFGNPFLVILDEPNANLDSDGDLALTRAIRGVRERGGIAVVIAHRPSALQAVDKVAMIKSGRLAAFGPKDEVLRNVLSSSGSKVS